MRSIAIPFILFALSLAIFSFQSDVVGLEFKGDEGFYFQSSRQMIADGDWITPYYFNKPRLEKPIFYYWLVAILFKLFGISWKIARFPSAISMAAVVVMTYIFARAFFNEKIGVLSASIAATTIATFRYARLALPEAFFVLLLCISLYLLLKKSYTLAYLLMGLAILTKGPVGFVLPIFIIAGYRYSLGEEGFFKDIRLAKGLLVALLVSLPWFLLMINIHGKPYIDHIFFRETIQRIGGFGDSLKAILYFIPVVFIFCLPWSIFLISAIRETASSIAKRGKYANGAVFSFIWFFAILIFFTFLGEKHRHYMLALIVPFSLMAGNYFYTLLVSRRRLKAFFIFVPAILSFFIFESAKLGMSKEIGGIGSLFLNKAYNIEKIDYVGIGSHSIVPQTLEVYVNHPVERVYFKWPNEHESDLETMNVLNKEFFHRTNGSFLLIKKSDFLKYIKPKTKKRLTILDKGYMYNKEAKISETFKVVSKLDREAFLELFREEVFFVTNKKEYIK